MAEALRKLIAQWVFDEDAARGCALSDSTKIGFDRATAVCRLRKQADGTYPLDAELYVVARELNPNALRAFLPFFEATVRHKAVDGEIVTSARFRLRAGVTDRWWDGAAWSPATTDEHWNTEQEVADNAPALARAAAVTSGQVRIRPVINLATTHPSVTPELVNVKLAYSAKLHSFDEDLLFESIQATLEREIRPVMDFVWEKFPGGTTVNVGTLLALSKMALNVVGVNAVFNLTADPGKLVDRVFSYDAASKILTFSGDAIPAQSILFLELIYQPDVIVVARHEDFVRTEKVPSLILGTIDTAKEGRMPPSSGYSCANRGQKKSLVLTTPLRKDWLFSMLGSAPGNRDEARLAEAVQAFFENNPTIKSHGTGETYTMRQQNRFTDLTSGEERNDVRSYECRFTIENHLSFLGDAEEIAIATGVTLGGNMTGSTP